MRLAIAADTLALGDEGAGAEIEIRSSAAAHMGFTPIETESLSKGGFERICQGSAIFVSWPVTVAPGASSDAALDVVPRAIPRVCREGPFRLSPVGGHARLPGVRGEPAPHLIHYLRRKHDGA